MLLMWTALISLTVASEYFYKILIKKPSNYDINLNYYILIYNLNVP